MTTSTSPDVRDRIFLAAKYELAEHGFAGARVDRIAKRAQTSKERIYAYFPSKDELLGEVTQRHGRMVDALIADALPDLEKAVGALFDFFNTDPRNVQITGWIILRRKASAAGESPGTPFAERAAQIRQAQAARRIREDWDPADILNYVFILAMAWAVSPQSLREIAAPQDLAPRRAAAQRAVRDLFKGPA